MTAVARYPGRHPVCLPPGEARTRDEGEVSSVTSVFDVAGDLIRRSPSDSMGALQLQKLCFYAFGWYAHLTGEALFPETFYAMEYGPVVGELLSAHAGRKVVKQEMILTQLRARDADVEPLGSYERSVLDAVWDAYGQEPPRKLIDRTHDEDVWISAWDLRPEAAKRGTMPHDAIVQHFLDRDPRPDEPLSLPPALRSTLSLEDRLRIESADQPHRPFIDSVRHFLAS